MTCPAPENPLAMLLDELGHCWLELCGCCRRIVFLPLRLLAEKHGGGCCPVIWCRVCAEKDAATGRR
jgi:hypothetical protein